MVFTGQFEDGRTGEVFINPAQIVMVVPEDNDTLTVLLATGLVVIVTDPFDRFLKWWDSK